MVSSVGDLTLDNVTVTDAGLNSSAVYNIRGKLTVRNSRVNNNSRGIYSYNGVTLIEDTEFAENTAGNRYGVRRGAAIYLHYGRSEIRNSIFKNNKADYFGGAVYLYQGAVSFDSSTFNGNEADYGGALYSDAESLIIRGCEFNNNIASSTWAEGGAMNLRGESPISLILVCVLTAQIGTVVAFILL